MTDRNALSRRLAVLEEAGLSPSEIEPVVGEIEDLDRIVAELEGFAQDTPWIAVQAQPRGKKD